MFANLKVGTRLAIGFGIVLLGTLLIAGVAWYALRLQSSAAREALDVHVRFTTSVLRARVQIANMRRFVNEMVIHVADAQAVKTHWDSWQKAKATADQHVKRALGAAPDDPSRKLVDKLARAIEAFGAGMTVLYSDLALGMMKDAGEANAKVDSFRTDINAADAAMAELFDSAMKRLDGTRESLAEVERRVQLLLIAASLVGILVTVALSILITRTITGPIDAAVRASERLAQGDLTHRIHVRGTDELARLMASLNGTAQQLNGIVSEIKRSSDTVNVAAQEIAQGHTDLSTRTEEQASSLEEAAASMEQMSATVAQNAENARKASKRASEASAVAERGGEVVATVVGTMAGISQSSRKIADIIGVIDGIAFQTNILALNAAVEAARAGEQGRGFAVVASEVRNLAQRSATAAKEIRQLIGDSVGRIDAGSKQVAHAGETMTEIVATIRRVNKRVAEISAASQEQSQSLTQVSDTVAQLEKVTQQNAAMVEEATAASDSLKEQATTLMHAVGGFKLAAEAQAQPQAEPLRMAPAEAPAASAALPRQPRPATAQPSLRAGELKPPRKGKDKSDEGWEEF